MDLSGQQLAASWDFRIKKSRLPHRFDGASRDSVSIDDPKLSSKQKLAVILGSEGEGLLDETIDNCDDTVCIPMFHGVDSLNVAAASAVAFWELGKN